MSMSANLHDVKKAEAWDLPIASSLRLTNSDNCSFTIFMPYATAVAMADAFNNPGRVKQLTDAIEALGAMPEGYCFCSKDRIGNDSKIHEPECRDLRAVLGEK